MTKASSEGIAKERPAEPREQKDLFDLVGSPRTSSAPAEGVVIGRFEGIAADGCPLVDFPGNPCEGPIPARSTIPLEAAELGCELALVFEGGEPARPVALGRILSAVGTASRTQAHEARLDGERIVLEAEREIVLRCGESSLVLTREGKVYLRGANVLSRSSGLNRIKGAAVRIN